MFPAQIFYSDNCSKITFFNNHWKLHNDRWWILSLNKYLLSIIVKLYDHIKWYIWINYKYKYYNQNINIHDIPFVVIAFLVPLLPLWANLSFWDATILLDASEENFSLMLMHPEHECKISWKNKSHSQQNMFWQSGHWYTVESRPSSKTRTHELQYWIWHSLALILNKNMFSVS